ncbi:unnamed protein product [Phaedon cochleariae]|uniref:Uncharacterized protein n=1 Tax=Phaedon cochleariae TaxID=80249 RepID=A0A9N9SK39_PHACE|nr:unnamed protein product [Phaedon cochleariae]
MSSSHRRLSKHEIKTSVLSGRRLTAKKNRGKSREENLEDSIVFESRGSKRESEEARDSYQSNIDHREVIFSAFYDSLLQSIVAEREIIENKDEVVKEKSTLKEDNQESEEELVNEEDVLETPSRNLSGNLIPSSSAKSNSFKEQPSSTISKKSEKISQESVHIISCENVAKCEELPKPIIQKIVFKNGNIYEGETFCNLIKGHGIFHWSDGTIYQGQFKNGYPTGEGKMILPDLSIYEGDFCNGYFHGRGILNVSATPIHYRGDWKNGKKHGNGWLMYEPGNWYEGSWSGDTKSGIGFTKYKSGSKYKGHWNDNVRKGKGKMMWENNDYYDGEWSGNLQNGYGEYTWNIVHNKSLCFPSYNWYKGSWEDGKRTGIGIMNFGTECGSKLGGTWYHNSKHGPGVMMCGNGKYIECNPLFLQDRPIHMNSRISPSDISDQENIDDTYQNDSVKRDSFKDILALIGNKVAVNRFPDEIILNITKNGMNLEGNNFLKLYDSISGNKKIWCPLKISIHSVADEVDLTYYIDLIFKYLNEEQKVNGTMALTIPQKDHQPKLHSINFQASVYSEKSVILKESSCETSVFNKENESKLKDAEAFYLKNQIIINLTRLTQIYNLYASFTKRTTLSFKPVLIRLFLWQLMRDIHLAQEGVSLIESDLILSKNLASCVETDHFPFETIYLYQFVQSLVGCSWLMYLAEKLTCSVIFGNGFVAHIFKEFLEEYVYPNAGNFTGSVLTDNKDKVPITAVYNLYLSLGEPLSVRTFLNSTCTKRGVDPPCYYAINSESNKKILKDGYNAVSVANEIHYLPATDANDDDDSLIKENMNVMNKSRDPFYRTLYTFRTLGKRTLTHCLARLCPKIIGPNLMTDLSYKLTFLEFYEALIKCALMKAEETRRDQELQLRECQKLITEQKMSVSQLSKTKERVGKKKKSKKSVLTF